MITKMKLDGGEGVDAAELNYLINHVFLPLKLPQSEDKNINSHDYVLLQLLHQTALKHAGSGSPKEWKTALGLIESMVKLQASPTNGFKSIKDALMKMKVGDVIALHIQHQNAGLIIRHGATDVVFEAFEVSPQNPCVIRCQGRLTCTYPGPVWSIPVDVTRDGNFIDQLASFLNSMSTTDFVNAMATTRKGGSSVTEVRETTEPKYIVEMLGGILRGLGKQAEPDRTISKNVRDDVLWKSCLVPWRRSPLWLVTRVALQTTLSDEVEYKRLMVEFMTEILSLALAQNLDSDAVSIMMKKVSRRAYKLGDINSGLSTLTKIHEVVGVAEELLKVRWAAVQQRSTRTIPWRASEACWEDTNMSLDQSYAYIRSRLDAFRNPPKTQPASFVPNEKKRMGRLYEFAISSSPFGGQTEFDRLVALVDFEECVAKSVKKGNIVAEVAGILSDELEAIRKLGDLIEKYTASAQATYKTLPECMSVFFLTVMELWCEMDKLVARRKHLLLDFSPEFRATMFEPLLLYKFDDMDRLSKVEEYIKGREKSKLSMSPSILSDTANAHAFAVRFFNQDSDLQILHRNIETEAEETKKRKLEELKTVNQKHRDLMATFNRTPCNSYFDDRGYKIHVNCPKCTAKKKANKLSIKTHEWPLPDGSYKSKTVVFETKPPEDFAIWRKTTYYILMDVFKTDKTGHRAAVVGSFDNIPELSRRRATAHRLSLGSTTKSWYSSHYKERKIDGYTQESQVCGRSAMSYRLYDTKSDAWASDRFAQTTIAPMCAVELASGPYKKFEYAVNESTHTSNDVIAKQNNCPKELTLEEYNAFCTLRSGSRLQWRNILQEFATGVLTFKRDAVHDLLRVAACQVGTASSGTALRDDHLDLGDADFGRELLAVMDKFLRSIADNWQEAVAAKTTILLANRVLSTARDAEVIRDALSFLSYARGVTLKWAREVVSRLQMMPAGADTQHDRNLIIHMAAICRMTFDVERTYHEVVLSDLAIYLECGLYIYDNCSNRISDTPREIRTVLMRDVRSTVQLEPKIQQLLSSNEEVLDQCVSSLWTSFKPGKRWEQLDAPCERWYTTMTSADNSQIPLLVHFNILENRLLVNGEPFGRLPYEIITHRTYTRLLAKRVLDIAPSSMESMTFETKVQVNKHMLHFSAEGKNLYIRAVSPAGKVYELIPVETLDQDFPRPLLEDMCHWLNLKTGEMEFRTLKEWSKLGDNEPELKLSSVLEDDQVSLSNRREVIVDIRSRTAELLSESLAGIETKSDMLISRDIREETISIKMPRYKLDFFCIHGSDDIECHTLPDHIVDTNQNIGTFVGLKDMLVLRHKSDPDGTSPRLVIVPHGTASPMSSEGAGTHPIVSISTKGDDRGFDVYTVDTKLGRLLDDGTLTARYTRIHLHALTSHCLPDPLTGRLGTVEALEGLRSEASFSFQVLNSQEFQILSRIASLTPTREYYPKHLKTMQTVEYSIHLPTLSQHDDFYPAVEAIVQHWNKIQPFCGFQPWTSGLEQLEPDLRRRAALRNKYLYGADVPAESALMDSDDEVYQARHFPSIKEAPVSHLTRLVSQWPQYLEVETGLSSMFYGMSSLSKSGQPAYRRLSYDEEWLSGSIKDLWLDLYDLCRHATKERDTYGLVFVLSSLLYAANQPLRLVKTLLAFATNRSFSRGGFNMPTHTQYPLSMGSTFDSVTLLANIRRHYVSFYDSDELNLPASLHESQERLWERRRSEFSSNCETQAFQMRQDFEIQWPRAVPSTPTAQYRLLNVSSVMRDATQLFGNWHKNKDFFDKLAEIERELRTMQRSDTNAIQFEKPTRNPMNTQLHERGNGIGLYHLLERNHPPRMVAFPPEIYKHSAVDAEGESKEYKELDDLLEEVKKKPGNFGEQYVMDMKASLAALRDKVNKTLSSASTINTLSEVQDNHRRTLAAVSDMFTGLHAAMSPRDNSEFLLRSSGLWPDITPLTIIQTLQMKNHPMVPQIWKTPVIRFGELLTINQKAERLLRSTRWNNVSEFHRELDNKGRENWSAEDYPDWLLIEIESNLLVRHVQASIALEMMQPGGDNPGNAVMQLNMGEGKSSVILPCVSASLADGTRLVRNVVLKPLSDQMFKLLREKLSGLVNRRIYFLPFSRSLNPTDIAIQQIRKIYEECTENGGILLTLPEHILSMRLMGIDKLTCGSDTAQSLLDLQKWVDETARDILDESDEILHVRYQLIYTVGTQQLPEGGAERWTILQEALNLFRQKAIEYKSRNPQAVEVSNETDSGFFPTIRVLNDHAGQEIIQQVFLDVFGGRLPSVSTYLRLLPKKLFALAKQFVTQVNIPENKSKTLTRFCAKSTFLSHLILLRGLFAHGILLFVFREKRYRVDYGLDPARKKYNLAVPYRAKDVPAPRAEFGHMDVLLMLTYLTYYAKGLSNEEIRLCFDLLYKTDNPDQFYDEWTTLSNSIPEALMKLRGINLEDHVQFEDEVCEKLRRNRGIIDFYLSTLIFPQQAKEFPEKISANGWDLAQEKPNTRNDSMRFTTGFSGTNDNRYLLPTPIKQQDKAELTHTNAMVLEYLLRPENKTVIHAHEDGQRLSAQQYLELAVDQKVKIFLDVGAQVLEYNNRQFAQKWLEKYNESVDPEIKGCIFFNKKDQLTILNRDGSIEAFTGSSTMNQQMDRFLVYLDEAHTRGTDLKLPIGSQAVVTLGPRLVKDKFVQGCMRMRKLAHGHSLVFFAPPEVYNNIIKVTGKTQGARLETKDVLLWTMLESCQQINHNFPNWASQGLQYDKRQKGWDRYRLDSNVKNLKDATLEAERRSLDDMYGPKYNQTSNSILANAARLEEQSALVKDIVRVCKRYGVTSLRNAEAEEEQEREVEQERERERQVERPPPIGAARQSVHPDVRNLAVTGLISSSSDATEPAFGLFERTSARYDCRTADWSTQLLATKDFLNTVQVNGYSNMDHYIRPARWILTSQLMLGTILIISPHEANELIREIQKSTYVQLHMYNPRVSRTALLDFENLNVCPTPRLPWSTFPVISPSVSLQLNLFAGQLFLKDHETYLSLCDFLGLYYDPLPDNSGEIQGMLDGFLSRESRIALGIPSARMTAYPTFLSSPVKFIEKLMNMRRKGLGYSSSHIGGIVHARILDKDDFRGNPSRS